MSSQQPESYNGRISVVTPKCWCFYSTCQTKRHYVNAKEIDSHSPAFILHIWHWTCPKMGVPSSHRFYFRTFMTFHEINTHKPSNYWGSPIILIVENLHLRPLGLGPGIGFWCNGCANRQGATKAKPTTANTLSLIHRIWRFQEESFGMSILYLLQGDCVHYMYIHAVFGGSVIIKWFKFKPRENRLRWESQLHMHFGPLFDEGWMIQTVLCWAIFNTFLVQFPAIHSPHEPLPSSAAPYFRALLFAGHLQCRP